MPGSGPGRPKCRPGPFELFRIDVRMSVLVSLDQAREHLPVDSWHVDRGLLATVR